MSMRFRPNYHNRPLRNHLCRMELFMCSGLKFCIIKGKLIYSLPVLTKDGDIYEISCMFLHLSCFNHFFALSLIVVD